MAEGLLGICKISFSSLVSSSGSDISVSVVQKCSNVSSREKAVELELEAKGCKRTYCHHTAEMEEEQYRERLKRRMF